MFKASDRSVEPSDLTASDDDRKARLISYIEQNEERWFWETDENGSLVYLSKDLTEQIELFGVRALGSAITDVFQLSPMAGDSARSLKFQLISRSKFTKLPVCGLKKLSDDRWLMSGRPWYDAAGVFKGFVGSGVDMTKEYEQEAAFRRLAVIDSLTGLANRQAILGSLHSWLKSEANKERHAALLMLDLDGFKAVNDTLGHPAGDALIKSVAERLVSVVEDDGIVGRLGGDEFLIFLPNGDDSDTLSKLSSNVIEVVSQPYTIQDRQICVSCSIGVSFAHGCDHNPDLMIRNADIALYAAKADGRSTYRFFESDMLDQVRRRKELEDELRFALNSNQLRLAYQPIIEVSSERLVGFEALLRWRHPVRGEISPEEFIPIAEESGLIQGIGDWVLRTAVNDLSRLPEDLRVAVNISAIQFRSPALLSVLANVIAQKQIDPDRLELEITETVFLRDEKKAQETFSSLKQLGVRLALDDFGTGYSSLGYLKSAPFDKIKIDKTFLAGTTDPDSRNLSIMKSIVSLANSLKMETTAEGVEFRDQIELVKSIGCSHIQGFVYGAGRDIDGLLALLKSDVRAVKSVGYTRKDPRKKIDSQIGVVSINGESQEVAIVDLSAQGAMISGHYWSDQMIGIVITIQIADYLAREAEIRWVANRTAGVQFFEPLVMELMSSPHD